MPQPGLGHLRVGAGGDELSGVQTAEVVEAQPGQLGTPAGRGPDRPAPGGVVERAALRSVDVSASDLQFRPSRNHDTDSR